MPKLIHNIVVTVFEKSEEKIENHKKIFQYLLPIDFKREKVKISIESVEGFNQHTIYIIQLRTKKSNHNTSLVNLVFSNMNEKDKKQIGKQYLTRLNQEGYFFIRLKKDKLLKKEFELTDSGNCYHFKIKLAGFPAKWNEFVKTAELLLSKYDCLENKKNEREL
jgi:RNA binding exosome subunit